jgi:hypothetical protein
LHATIIAKFKLNKTPVTNENNYADD